MRPPSLIIGYHGCDRKIGESVLHAGGQLTPSENDYDWLGAGIYFWENDPVRAYQWAVQKKAAEPFVIGALLSPKFCLDLTEQDSLARLAEAHAIVETNWTLLEKTLPENSENMLNRRLDCLVINSLHEYRKTENLPPYDSVRGPFWEGGELYPGAGIREKSHVQIAVRDMSVILGYFLPALAKHNDSRKFSR